ncbi:MAG: hypothetical protein Q4B69_08380 [Slackia sp.]|nr:hypothetical protein [Slackia sp.]
MQQSNRSHSASPSPRRIAGFSCYQGFIYAVFYMGANRALEAGPFAFERADLLATLAVMVVAFAGMNAFPRFARRILASDAALAACAGAISLGVLAFRLSESAHAPGLLLEALLMGVPLAVLLIAWGRVLGLSSPRIAACEIFASTCIAAAVCLVASFSGYVAQTLFAIALPAASTGILLVSGAGTQVRADVRNRLFAPQGAPAHESAQTDTLSRRMLFGAVIFGLAAGLMETFRSNPGASSTPTFPATLLMLALFCIAVLQSLRAGHEEDNPLGNAYRIAILVMMAGFLFMPARRSRWRDASV